jgi:lipopolysaccharide export system permease protein
VVFYHGERVQGVPGQLDFVIEKFQDYAVRVEEPDTAVFYTRTAVAAETLWVSGAAVDRAELQRRWSVPLGMLLLSLLAVPLAQVSPRGGVFGNILIGFVIYFCYGNLLRISQLWVTKEVIPVWLGGAGVNFLLLAVGGVLLARLYGWRWLYSHLAQRGAA